MAAAVIGLFLSGLPDHPGVPNLVPPRTSAKKVSRDTKYCAEFQGQCADHAFEDEFSDRDDRSRCWEHGLLADHDESHYELARCLSSAAKSEHHGQPADDQGQLIRKKSRAVATHLRQNSPSTYTRSTMFTSDWSVRENSGMATPRCYEIGVWRTPKSTECSLRDPDANAFADARPLLTQL
jgi:hypothetical protein